MDRERVVIVGAGPVGMTAALGLARRDVPVTVVEAGEDLSTESRASTFHPPTLQMLDELGVIDALLDVGLKAPIMQYRDFDDGIIAEFDTRLLAAETPYPFRLQCEQHILTRVIRAEIARSGLDVELQYGQRVESAQPAAQGAVLRLASPGAAGHEMTASYVVGADGAHSAVREGAGIDFPGATYADRYLVLTTSVDLGEVMPGLAYVNYVVGPKEWCAIIRTHRIWRALYPVPPDETTERALDPGRVQERLAGLGNVEGGYPVQAATIYRVHQRLAASFRRGSLLLAGDAAHINNPLGGLGMNSGIHDAYFLAQVLARVWKNEEDETVLDRYAAVRRTVCETYVNRVGDSNYAALRQRELEARRRYAASMRELASDDDAARGYMRTALMLESVRKTRQELFAGAPR